MLRENLLAGVKGLSRQASDGVRTHVSIRLDVRAMAILDRLARRLGTRTRVVEAALLALDGQGLVLDRLDHLETLVIALAQQRRFEGQVGDRGTPSTLGVDMTQVAGGLLGAFGGADED